MTTAHIIALQDRIGTEPDGFWGPASIAACIRHLRGLMPYPNPWPSPDQDSLRAFYGTAGDESRLVNIDVRKLGVDYDDEPVKTIRVHERCADSLLRVLTAISKLQERYVLLDYAGVFSNRPMRGGRLPSLHARGAAIDLRPQTNGNHVHWPVASDMPLAVMEAFSREGWKSAGAFWGRDAMHFQATV
jgi:hypothetical protein